MDDNLASVAPSSCLAAGSFINTSIGLLRHSVGLLLNDPAVYTDSVDRVEVTLEGEVLRVIKAVRIWLATTARWAVDMGSSKALT